MISSSDRSDDREKTFGPEYLDPMKFDKSPPPTKNWLYLISHFSAKKILPNIC